MSWLDQAIGGFQEYCFGSRRFYTRFAGCLGLSGFIRDSPILVGDFRVPSRFVASYPFIGDIFGLPTSLGMLWLPCLFRKSRIFKRETGFFAYGGTVHTVLRRLYTPVCEMPRIFYRFRLFRVGGATKGIGDYSPCIQN